MAECALTEQEKRNYIRQSNDNLFVEAGAGAGKTTFISKRIINQMKKGARPQEFVFITFTNEATVELYTKIEKNITREMRKTESLYELSGLVYTLEKLPEMNIMTIYRFCYGLLVMAGKARGIKEADFIGSEGMSRAGSSITERTRRLLMEDKAFLHRVREKYRHIYVDEFQDTNEDQASILLMIAGAGDDAEEVDRLIRGEKTGYRLRDDSVFLVGDERQSIYRDEGARVEVFLNVRKYMSGCDNARLISLEVNYRSEALILAWINDHFSGHFENYLAMKGDWQIKDKSSFHGVMRAECGSYEQDFSATLCLIKKLLEDENTFIEEKDAGTLRRFKYSDFLVLIMREENTSSYLAEAEKLGIPAITTGKFSIDKNENAVRIMTLKKAKGLAGNVVIIADRSLSRREYFERYNEEESCAEWERFEYVAATRARHALIFMPELTKGTEFSAKGYGIDSLRSIII